jgi:hypothetical protein
MAFKIIPAVAVTVLALALAGCVHKTAYLTNQTGSIASCSAKGFGLIPLILEETSYDDCMQFYREHGYIDAAASGYAK